MKSSHSNSPLVTGISPHQGSPGTQITIRGQNLGEDPNDIVALIICGTDCLATAKWKSSSKIVARLGGQAKRGVGDILIVTRSGGRGHSEVQFRVFIEQIGPLQESIVWVDESKTVPGRNLLRNVGETNDNEDALELGVDPQKKLDHSTLLKYFPDSSGSRKMDNFNPLSCVDALAKLQSKIQQQKRAQKEAGGQWPTTIKLSEKLDLARETADQLFKDVLARKDAADSTRNALSVLTRFRFIFFLAEQIEDNLAKGEYATILNDYARAKALFKDTEVSLFKEVMAVLDEKIDRLRGIIRKLLVDITTPFEEQSRLIKYLKILDPESDPAWDCMMAYHGWLESMLWELQRQFHAQEEQSLLREDANATSSISYDLDTPRPLGYFRQAFVTDLLSLLTDKLHTFWKISQNFAVTGSGTTIASLLPASLAEATEIQERQMDIDQMLANTINVASWLLLNALVPGSLPESVTKQHTDDQFVQWSPINSAAQWNVMFSSIKLLRNSIKALIDCQLARHHLQPLFELCTTVRLKCLGMLVERGKEAIIALGTHENWRVDLIADVPRTALPDRFEAELNELLPDMKCILSYGNFPGETDLFVREKWRHMITDLFTVLLLGFRDCCDHLLKLKSQKIRQNQQKKISTQSTSSTIKSIQRPTTLSADTSLISNGSIELEENNEMKNIQKQTISQEQLSRRFLTVIANIEFLLNHSLSSICRRLGDNGLKFSEQVFKHTKHLPDDDDVSEFVKELMLCTVFVQSEMASYCYKFIQQVLGDLVKVAFEHLFNVLARVDFSSSNHSTQVIVDLTAFEEAFQGFVTTDM
uniref:Exocyst complex component 2 n=1 Tax=Meloidogyne javanica TaxID=6303 RepID=A0A915M6E6_MELJA